MQLRSSSYSSHDGAEDAPVVIRLGKAKRKQIKRLKKGKGRLMEEIAATVEAFKEDQRAKGRDVVPLVFVCREKRPRIVGLMG